MIDEQTQEDASLYALGLLPPDEAVRFETALAADHELAALVAGLETAAAAFAASVPPRPPPEPLRERIIAQVRDATPAPGKVVSFPNRLAWLPWAIAACLALLTGWLTYQRYALKLLVDDFLLRDYFQQHELDVVQGRETALTNRLNDALSRTAATGEEKAALQAKVASLRQAVADLKARDALSQVKIAALASLLKGAPQAMALVAWDPAAQRGILKTANVPAAQPGQDYQLWIIDPGYKQPVSAGVFDPAAAAAAFHPVQPISQAGKFAISLEKKGGSPTPQGPVVLISE